MAVVKINAIKVPEGNGPELEKRFAARLAPSTRPAGLPRLRAAAPGRRRRPLLRLHALGVRGGLRGVARRAAPRGRPRGRARPAGVVGRRPAGVRGRPASTARAPEPVTRARPGGRRRGAELIAGADALLVCAGAGMGVDSGLPDFRGPEGFWRAYPPYRRLGLRFEELADPVHFADDPELAWGFYGHRLALYRRTVPHAGFAVLRRWARPVADAGVHLQRRRRSSRPPGSPPTTSPSATARSTTCSAPGRATTAPGRRTTSTSRSTRTPMRARPPLPTCPRCGAVARPNILMFGDGDWVPGAATPSATAAHREWLRAQDAQRLAVVELGAGTAVPTVRRHAELASAASGALIRINVREPRRPPRPRRRPRLRGPGDPRGARRARSCQLDVRSRTRAQARQSRQPQPARRGDALGLVVEARAALGLELRGAGGDLDGQALARRPWAPGPTISPSASSAPGFPMHALEVLARPPRRARAARGRGPGASGPRAAGSARGRAPGRRARRRGPRPAATRAARPPGPRPAPAARPPTPAGRRWRTPDEVGDLAGPGRPEHAQVVEHQARRAAPGRPRRGAASRRGGGVSSSVLPVASSPTPTGTPRAA